MPRDAADTRALLLAHAERLLAQRGVFQATTREITEAAGQRNASALTYHFGSRAGLLYEILRRHGTPLDQARGELLGRSPADCATRALVAALVLPLAGCLETESGRNYLRVVAQLRDRFAAWRVGAELTPPELRDILGVLEVRCGDDLRVGRQRVVGCIMLLTAAMAERARLVEESAPQELDTDEFVTNLTDMIVAALEAPPGPPVAGPGPEGRHDRREPLATPSR